MVMLMPSIQFEVETFGFDDVDKYLSSLKPRHMTQVRDEMWDWGEEMIFIAQILSPKDKIRPFDYRRRPLDESFSKQWRWQLEATPTGPELQVGNIDEKMGWIIEGTDPRRITASDWEHPMYFFWEDGWAGAGFYTDWVIIGGVASEGTPPHPVHIQTLENFDVSGHIARLASRLT